MHLSKFNIFSKKNFIEECKTFFSATLIALLVFVGTYAYDAYAATSSQQNTLTVTIAASVTFVVTTNSFGTLTPGTPVYATSTTAVTTNSTAWNIQMYGNNQGSNAASTTLYFSSTPYSPGIPDGTEWVPGGGGSPATTTAGNATTTALLGTQILAFRVMTASGTAAFRAPTWWGTVDAYPGGATTLWAGVASSTVGRRIGIVSGYSASQYLNTVQYYLDVLSSQQQGLYTGDLTFTWTDSA